MGQLPMAEAVRLSMNLAESLRRLHDEGRVHGALTPALVELGTAGLELLPAPDGANAAITPYTAPEVAEGQPPDARADIFAFGVIMFEMATGVLAFDESHDAPPSSGSVALDRVVGACIARNPEERIPRIHKVMLELKLLAVATRRTEAAATLRRERSEGATRLELREMESRLEARFALQAEAQARIIDEFQRAAHQAAETFREQLSVLCSELSSTQERMAQANSGLQTLGESTEGIKRAIEEITRRSQQFEQSVFGELMDLGRQTKAHNANIQATRTHATQNEELIERVIEALDSLQNDVLESKGAVEEEATLAS
jgi:methyl-accepting chemotaxis protein